MDRRVPTIGSEEIDLYIRTYYSLLRSTTEVQIRTLEEVHSLMQSSLHLDARDAQPDLSAFIYSSLRLPSCMIEVDRVILGQSVDVFRNAGFGDITRWDRVSARARRRRAYFNNEDTMASFIASRSDIDDLIPMLTAFQIEWNKLHRQLQGEQVKVFLQESDLEEDDIAVLAEGSGIRVADLHQLWQLWGEEFWATIAAIAADEKKFKVRLLSGSLNDYRKATQVWWQNVQSNALSFNRPVYFISSNTHSFVNLLTGSALREESALVEFMHLSQQKDMLEEWDDIQAKNVPSSRENFLYYALKKYASMNEGTELLETLREAQEAIGIRRIPSEYSFELETQVIELSALRADWLDPRLRREDLELLQSSNSLILNIDYPLGMAAYLILSHLASRVGNVLGVYIMGKSASLNGVVGDVMIPSVVFDEHSKNTYLFRNCFSAAHVSDDLIYGTVLDNQKAVSVRGTFLQTPRYMDLFYREGYTDIEMEAGPFLSAIYELSRPKRHPENEIVNLHGLSFDLGILHYVSDTPLSKGKNLGAGSLSYFGMDPTYASSLTILKRIFDLELTRIRSVEHSIIPQVIP